jgi:hypothetical protein
MFDLQNNYYYSEYILTTIEKFLLFFFLFATSLSREDRLRLERENNENEPQDKPVETDRRKSRNPFQVSHIKEAFITAFKARPNGLRLCIIILIISFQLESFVNSGEYGHLYLYLRRALNFEFSDWTQYRYIIYLKLSKYFLLSLFFVYLPELSLVSWASSASMPCSHC